MPEKRKPPPKGWLEVTPVVARVVQDAISALGPGIRFSDTDAWGAGISPRMVRMIQTLATPEARIGPTSVAALRKMLLMVDDKTYALMGGTDVLLWAFAPKEYATFMRLQDRGADDATLRAAAEAAQEAADAAVKEWLESHPDDVTD